MKISITPENILRDKVLQIRLRQCLNGRLEHVQKADVAKTYLLHAKLARKEKNVSQKMNDN